MGLIHELIAKTMSEVGAVTKDGFNDHHKYKFRSIDQVYNAVNSALIKNHIFTAPKVLKHTIHERPSKSGGIAFHVIVEVQYTFYAPDGSSVECVLYGEALDTSDKATNKAMAFAHKYALLQVFCIPTEDIAEGDCDHVEVIQKKSPLDAPKAPPAKTFSGEDYKCFMAHLKKSFEFLLAENKIEEQYIEAYKRDVLGVRSIKEVVDCRDAARWEVWIKSINKEVAEQTKARK